MLLGGESMELNLWIIVNHAGHIVHQTSDFANLDLMKRYVIKSRESGDDWKLLKYSLEEVITCESQTSMVAS